MSSCIWWNSPGLGYFQEIHFTLVELFLRIFEVEMELLFFYGRQHKHGVRQDALANSPESTGAELVFNRLIDHKIQHLRVEAQLDAFQFEQLFILADE